MILVEHIHTKERKSFSTIYQMMKYFFELGVAKNIANYKGIKRAIKTGSVVYKYYVVSEIPDAK